SNAKGFFSVPNNIKQIELSSIGYNTKTMILNRNTDTIFLSPQIYKISETRVLPSKKKRKPVELGYAKEKAKYFIGFFSGGEIATYIPLNNEDNVFRLIKKVIIRGKTDNVTKITLDKTTYKVNKTGYKSVFKINFYRVTASKEIGERINTEDIVFTSEVLKSRTVLDVSKYNIYMPETGIFVAVEFVGTIDAETGEIIPVTKTGIFSVVHVSYEISNSVTFEKRKFKRERNNDWEKSVRDTVLHKEFNNGYTPLISIVLE
ncbi:MAG: hypothetical protein LBP63_05160, partial [Prevotellaceae bacterium]|nr:hypothetical protein [Prevotellaceae bacterium]